MAKTKEEKLKVIHENAIKQFSDIQAAVRDERLQCLEDRRFYSIAGAQWEGELGDQFENKPRFEVNKVHLSVMRIINEYRNNRITVDFISKEGKEYDELADTCDGLYRADEQDSTADEAYDNAFEEAVGGGFGAWRLTTEYEDDEDYENDEQRIRIEPIYDADSSVFFDINAKRQDKSDARYCFVISSMSVEAYEEEFEESAATLQKEINQTEFDWVLEDVVYIAEYYKIEEKKDTVLIFETLEKEEERYLKSEMTEEELSNLEDLGATLIGEKKIKRKKVHKYIIDGAKVLEDCGYIAGTCIPIIPVYGKRWFIDNIERCMGHVRLAKDAQRLMNMQLSKLGELSAKSSVEKPILAPEQIAGHEEFWAEDNIKDYPYLLVNPITDMNGNAQVTGPVAYTKPPQIAPALAALLQITNQDMIDLTGGQQAGEQIVSNISGKAVEMIQDRLDMQTYIYMSNMAKAMKRSGQIWLSMANDIFVEKGRKLKTVDKNGQAGMVELMKPQLGDEGEIEYKNDMTEAKFDIAVDIGPSSSSKRSSTVRALTGMMQMTSDPETMQILGATAIMNMEGEGIGDLRDYFRQKLIRLGAIKPTEEELQQMAIEAQNKQPDANTTYLNAAAAEAEAKAMKAQADTALSVAKAQETEAKTAETIAGIDRDDREQAIKIAQEINKSLGGIEQ